MATESLENETRPRTSNRMSGLTHRSPILSNSGRPFVGAKRWTPSGTPVRVNREQPHPIRVENRGEAEVNRVLTQLLKSKLSES